MMEVIFSKYSNDRANAFSIRTDIVKDENGNRCVCKSAATEEAKGHIAHIYESYVKLQERYQGILEINRGELRDDSVRLEYLEGVTLGDYLETLLKNHKKEEAIEIIAKYREAVLHSENKTDFVITDPFREIFGDVDLGFGQLTAEFTDIDMVFENIVVHDGTWTLIDYEWSFDFPIPEKYVLYRTAEYFYADIQAYQMFEFDELLALFGISKEEKNQYYAMERNFQLYIQGNDVALRDMQKVLGTSFLPLPNILDKASFEMQIFYDYGEGFREEDSHKEKIYNNTVSGQISCKDKIKAIRIDPCDRDCLVFIERFEENGHDISDNLITNATEIQNRLVYFKGNDPQIVLHPQREDSEFAVKLYVIPVIKEADGEICRYFEENRRRVDQLNAEIGLRDAEIGSLNTRIGSLNTEVGSLNTEIGSLNTRIESLNAEIGSQSAKIGSLNTEIHSLNAQNDATKEKLHRMEELVIASQSRVALYENSRKIKLLKKLRIIRM